MLKGKNKWVVAGIGAVAIAAGAAGGYYAYKEAKYAALGHQVHDNVVKFLVDSGASVAGNSISGGIVSKSMTKHAAVNTTVVTMLNAFADQLGGKAPNPTLQEGDEIGVVTTPKSDIPQKPHGRSPGRRATGGVKNPSSSPDDGGYADRESQESSPAEATYNPEEFVPKGERPPPNTDLFKD